MTEDQSRWIVVTLVLVCAIPLQAIAMWTRNENSWLDWLVLGALLLVGFAHIEGPPPDPEG